jgi:hypothetical protein
LPLDAAYGNALACYLYDSANMSGDIKAVDIEVAFGRGEILQISYYNILAES